MTELNDKINYLLDAIVGGNEYAVQALYETVAGRMLSVAFGVLKNRQLAEEAVNDSYIKVIKKAGGFLRGSNGYAWICKITRNTALDKLKREKLNETVSIDEFYNLSTGKDDIAETDNVILVETAMAKLTEKERKLIYYKYFLDLTVREVAKKTGMSKSSVARESIIAEEKLKAIIKLGQNE